MDIKMYFCTMSFDIVKSLHIIFVVCWFAGLFYMVRLFIYHKEAQIGPVDEKTILSKQFKIMEHKLWWIITTPSMVLTVLFGAWMIVLNHEYYLTQPWMHLKLLFVLLLILYHFFTQRIMYLIQSESLRWSSTQLRLWNELATLFLVAIVFIVVLKSTLNWLYGTVGFFAVGLGLMIAVRMYKRFRS